MFTRFVPRDCTFLLCVQSLLVVEEYDKADCATRAMLRQLLDHGSSGDAAFPRSVVVLEANTGFLHLHRLLKAAGGRARVPAEGAHNALKDLVAAKWARDACEARIPHRLFARGPRACPLARPQSHVHALCVATDFRYTLPLYPHGRVQEPEDRAKLLSLIDAFVPFLPLERSHIRVRRGSAVSRRVASRSGVPGCTRRR